MVWDGKWGWAAVGRVLEAVALVRMLRSLPPTSCDHCYMLRSLPKDLCVWKVGQVAITPSMMLRSLPAPPRTCAFESRLCIVEDEVAITAAGVGVG